jgi:hypothetical protein
MACSIAAMVARQQSTNLFTTFWPPRTPGRHWSIKWYLWHGNGFQALQHLQFVEMDLEGAAFENQEETTRKLLKAVAEFGTYIQRNRGFIPNYGERYRNGERISTGFVESAVNQVISKRFVKKQQMRWTPRGAHLLLQTRTKVLNGDLDDTFLSKLPNGWR